jgi:hypothetical protein
MPGLWASERDEVYSQPCAVRQELPAIAPIGCALDTSVFQRLILITLNGITLNLIA